MQIEKIIVENFKGIERVSLAPQKINVLLGENGCGKSSFLCALGYALGGLAQDLYVRSGSKQTKVQMKLRTASGPLEIERLTIMKPDGSFAGKLRVNSKTTTQKSLAEMLENQYGATMDTIRFLSSSEAMQSMSAGDFSEFLLTNKLIPASMNLDKLYSICTLSKDAETELAMYLPPTPELFGLEEIDDAYQYYFDARTDLKREYAAHKARITVDPSSAVSCRSLEDIERELEQLLLNEGESRSKKDAVKAYDLAFASLKSMREKATAIEEQAAKIAAKRPNPSDLTKMAEEKNSFSQHISDLTSVTSKMEQNAERFQNILAELDKSSCPISKRLTCTTDKTSIRGELSKVIADNGEGLKKQKEALADQQEKLKSLTEKIEEYHKNDLEYQKKLGLLKQAEQLRGNLPKLPPKPDLKLDETDYAVKKENLKNEKIQTKNLADSLKEQKIAEELLKKITVHDEILTKLSPKGGIREKVLDVALQGFEKFCNEKAAKFKMNFQIRFLCENGVHVQGKTSEITGFQEFKDLSTGEQLDTSFLVLDLISMLTGLKILVLDNLESLDDKTIEKMLELIGSKEVQDAYDHIFLAAVNHESIRSIMEKRSDLHFCGL